MTFRCNFHNIAQITFPDCRGVSYEEMVPEAPASAVSLLSQLVSRRGDIWLLARIFREVPLAALT